MRSYLSWCLKRCGAFPRHAEPESGCTTAKRIRWQQHRMLLLYKLYVQQAAAVQRSAAARLEIQSVCPAL
jgi:hypothetical protein